MTLEFFVPGVPQPQGSKTAFVVKGKAVIVDKNPTLLKPWRKSIAAAAAAAASGDPLDGAVRLEAVFVMPRGASVTREFPSVRPDIDKLFRALMDGITDAKNVWGDDAQVTSVELDEVYDDGDLVPGVRVVLKERVSA